MNTNLKQVEKVLEQKEKIERIKRSAKNKVSGKGINKQKYLITLQKKKIKYAFKTGIDVKVIHKVMEGIKEGYDTKLISNRFDSPSILYALHEKYEIKNVFISTWAVTDRGICAIDDLSKSGKIEIFILMDTTHSYKWIFSSGAYEVLKNGVHFKFTENHSKFVLIETKCGKKISFVGSMNLSNNPRLENIDISLCEDNFNFYKDFIMSFFDAEKEKKA